MVQNALQNKQLFFFLLKTIETLSDGKISHNEYLDAREHKYKKRLKERKNMLDRLISIVCFSCFVLVLMSK